jgi:Flp pilus assembly protein TadD
VPNSLDTDLRFGQIAVRMGMLPAHELPKLVQEARTQRQRSGEDTRKNGLGQLLVRRKLLSVSEYLYVAREVEKNLSGEDSGTSLRSLEVALKEFEEGKRDGKSLETALSSEDVRITMPSREEMPPTFGRYELLDEVARGGMGIVYRAKDTANDSIVALKVMIEADDDEARLKRFVSEAELARQLDHPGIVKVYDAGTIDGMPYFTMDLVDGKSLDDLIEQGIDRFTAIDVLAQTARAADHAHKRGIVHRDLKPGNILVESASGRARVTDFGLAREMDRNTRITRVGQAVGTPYYMAPEQVRGERDVDGRADTYAVGVMLYEILTGEVPFDADSALTLFKKIDREPVNLPLDPSRGIDEKIHAIAMRALEKKREDRYASSKLLAEDLERYLKGVQPKARANTALDGFKVWLATNKRALLVGALAAVAVLVVSVGAVAVASHLLSGKARVLGRETAQAALEHANKIAEVGETSLAAGPAEALSSAERALDEIDRAHALARGESPRAVGAQEAWKAGADPIRRRVLCLQGRALEAEAKIDKAQKSFEEAALIPGPDAALLRTLGALRRKNGDSAGAVESLEKAIELNPKDALPRIDRGEALLESDKVDLAISELSEALRPQDLPIAERVRALLLRSNAYVQKALATPPSASPGRDDPHGEGSAKDALAAARDDADGARDLAGRSPEPFVAAVACHRARAALETNPEKRRAALTTALQACQDAQVAAPASPLPWVARGDILLGHGRFALAALAYDEAVKLAPPERDYEERLGRGIARAHLFELVEARADLDLAARHAASAPLAPMESTRARALLRARIATDLAQVLVAQGDTSFAKNVLLETTREFATIPGPFCALARLELTLDETDAAIEHLAKASPLVKKESRDAVLLHEALARAHLQKNEPAVALQEADIAAALLGPRPDARVRRAQARARALQAGEGDPAAAENAKAAWRESFLLDLDACEMGRPWLDLATELLRSGWEDALLAAKAMPIAGSRLPALSGSGSERLEACLRLDPGRVPALVALAELERARGRSENALELARRCTAIDASCGRAFEIAAEALLASDAVAAAEAANRALALGETQARLLLAARAEIARGAEGKRAGELLAKLKALPDVDDENDVEATALSASLEGGKEAADRVRSERAAARANALAQALELETSDPARAREVAERLIHTRQAGSTEARSAFLLVARLGTTNANDRIVASLRAVLVPDAAVVDSALRTLDATRSPDLPNEPTFAALAKHTADGELDPAMFLGLARLEEVLARPPSPIAALFDLDGIDASALVVPGSLIPRLARAELSVLAGDLETARRDVRALREIAPVSALVFHAAAQLALGRGEQDVARDLVERAQRIGLPALR